MDTANRNTSRARGVGMTRGEVIEAMAQDIPGEQYILVRRSTRHKRRADEEKKKYIRIEVDDSQRKAFYDLRELLIEQCNGSPTQAFDRILSGMAQCVAEENGQ
jgi:hypothetical protein